VTQPTFHERAAALIDTARPDDTLVIASATGDHMVLQCRPVRAADLAHIARAVLDQAAETILNERGAAVLPLRRAIAAALAALPDPHADQDDDGKGEAA
jgi:hypothetical protein